MSGVHQQSQLSRTKLSHVCAMRLVAGRCFSSLAPYIFQSPTREGHEMWKYLPVSDVKAGPRATNCDCCSGCRYDFLSILSTNASGSDVCGICCQRTLVDQFLVQWSASLSADANEMFLLSGLMTLSKLTLPHQEGQWHDPWPAPIDAMFMTVLTRLLSPSVPCRWNSDCTKLLLLDTSCGRTQEVLTSPTPMG